MEEPTNHPNSVDINADVSEKVDKVFRNHVILDIILDYAIHNGRDMTTSNVRSLRLVNKGWLQSTHRILRKSQRSLFYIQWFQKGFTVGKGGSPKTGNNVGKFLRSLHNGDSLAKHVPPHGISASEKFISQRNHSKFLKYLATCGSSLTELRITFDNDAVLPLATNILLPRLKAFAAMLDMPGTAGNSPPLTIVQNRYDFIQNVLEGSEQLKYFELWSDVSNVPDSFGKIRLPSSLEELDFVCTLTNRSLEILVNNSLPNMKILSIRAIEMPVKDGLITNILKNVSKTLKDLSITQENQQPLHKGSSKFQLPLMEKLEKLEIKSNLELGGNLSSLQERAPVLKSIILKNQTSSMFRKWTDQSCFSAMETLNVSFCESLETRTMESLTCAYPNLYALIIEFGITGGELSALVPLLKKMRSLRKLHISVTDDGQLVSSDAWDALLLGIPVESVAELRGSPASLVEMQDEIGASIRNLTELETLELESRHRYEFPIISDAVFNCAFFSMPKLTELCFSGGFYTTSNMADAWRRDGRQIFEED